MGVKSKTCLLGLVVFCVVSQCGGRRVTSMNVLGFDALGKIFFGRDENDSACTGSIAFTRYNDDGNVNRSLSLSPVQGCYSKIGREHWINNTQVTALIIRQPKSFWIPLQGCDIWPSVCHFRVMPSFPASVAGGFTRNLAAEEDLRSFDPRTRAAWSC